MQKKDKSATVYNFEVEDFHTYFVGNSKLWVHNGDCLVEQIARGHAWDHVKDGDFADLGIENTYGGYQKFADLISYVMRNPSAVKEADVGLNTHRLYYYHRRDKVMVVEWVKEQGDNVYDEKSTCYRVTGLDPEGYWDNLPGDELPVP